MSIHPITRSEWTRMRIQRCWKSLAEIPARLGEWFARDMTSEQTKIGKNTVADDERTIPLVASRVSIVVPKRIQRSENVPSMKRPMGHCHDKCLYWSKWSINWKNIYELYFPNITDDIHTTSEMVARRKVDVFIWSQEQRECIIKSRTIGQCVSWGRLVIGNLFLSGVYSLFFLSPSLSLLLLWFCWRFSLIEEWSMMSSWMLFLSFTNIAMLRARYWWSW